MSTTDEMGLTPEAAAGYEEYFVPAIFDQWPSRIIDIIGLKRGDHVLEVGCGTGVFAREAVNHIGDEGRFVGLDLSESMLGVARRKCPDVEFRQGNAMALPFDDQTFDVVVASFMLMFVPEPETAIKEMLRVLKPEGKIAVAVWESLDQNPAYSTLCEIAGNRIDATAAESLAWPFALGDKEKLSRLFASAGMKEATLHVRDGRARFPSLENFVRTEIKSWVLAESVTEEGLTHVVNDAKEKFASYCDPKTGGVDLPLNAIIASAKR